MNSKKTDKELIIHAYDNVLDCCARLYNYTGEAKCKLSFNDIFVRQRMFAIDDLIKLSINARRLMVFYKNYFENNDININKIGFYIKEDNLEIMKENEQVNIFSLFGIIIHSEFLETIDSEFSARLFNSKSNSIEEIIKTIVQFQENNFTPKIFVESDRKNFIFDLCELIESIDQFFLPVVSEAASDGGLYLENDYRF